MTYRCTGSPVSKSPPPAASAPAIGSRCDAPPSGLPFAGACGAEGTPFERPDAGLGWIVAPVLAERSLAHFTAASALPSASAGLHDMAAPCVTVRVVDQRCATAHHETHRVVLQENIDHQKKAMSVGLLQHSRRILQWLCHKYPFQAAEILVCMLSEITRKQHLPAGW